MIRKTLFFGVIPAAGFAIAAHFFWPIPFWVFLFWIPIKFWMDLRYHQKFAYTLTDEFIYIRSGVFGLKNKLCKLYKVQTVNLNETPYQHRKGLADLVIYTASGKFRIPYIEREKAIEMRDLILDRLERSEQAWM